MGRKKGRRGGKKKTSQAKPEPVEAAPSPAETTSPEPDTTESTGRDHGWWWSRVWLAGVIGLLVVVCAGPYPSSSVYDPFLYMTHFFVLLVLWSVVVGLSVGFLTIVFWVSGPGLRRMAVVWLVGVLALLVLGTVGHYRVMRIWDFSASARHRLDDSGLTPAEASRLEERFETLEKGEVAFWKSLRPRGFGEIALREQAGTVVTEYLLLWTLLVLVPTGIVGFARGTVRMISGATSRAASRSDAPVPSAKTRRTRARDNSPDEEDEESTSCISCDAIIPSGSTKCPQCGWSYSE